MPEERTIHTVVKKQYGNELEAKGDKRTGSGLGSRRPRDQSIFNSRWKSHDRMSKSTTQLGAGTLHEEETGCGRAKGNMAKTTMGSGARTPEAWHARREE